jgi:hypothetical protein
MVAKNRLNNEKGLDIPTYWLASTLSEDKPAGAAGRAPGAGAAGRAPGRGGGAAAAAGGPPTPLAFSARAYPLPCRRDSASSPPRALRPGVAVASPFSPWRRRTSPSSLARGSTSCRDPRLRMRPAAAAALTVASRCGVSGTQWENCNYRTSNIMTS